VTAETVAPIVAKLPADVEKIGVFLNETPRAIAETVRKAGLTGVQLHGDETLETAEQLASITSAKIVKGVHAGPDLERDLALWAGKSFVSALLLDSGNGQQGGGTGKTFDWDEAARALKAVHGSTRVVVAGGLRPENVRAAMLMFHPWGVDVVSGVELEPGRKDPEKVRAFTAAVRRAQS
jgi:phosphoribosylanthranilate isomerase